MAKIFLDVLNISITASWLILAVLLLRFVLKRFAPKWTLCLVWALVAIRLVIPFSVESELSLVPSSETIKSESLFYDETSKPSYEHSQIFEGNFVSSPIEQNTSKEIIEPLQPIVPSVPNDFIDSGFEGVDKTVNPIIQNAISKTEQDNVKNQQKWLEIAGFVWISGIAAMLLYAVVNYIILKKRVSIFVPEGNIRKSENVESPFILGFFNPKIYLPFGLSEDDEVNIIAHERAHLSRGDHLVKPISFLILAFYWFNPLCWVAYILLCRDIELACDEKVVKNLDDEARKSYATALLHCGTKRRIISACPVAFGEIGVKARIMNVMNYKKPVFWIIVISIICISVLAVLFLTNPTEESDSSSEEISDSSSSEVVSEDNSEEKESWTETVEKDGKKIVTKYSDNGESWNETISEEKDGMLVYEKITVFKDGNTTETSEKFYDSNGKVLKSESFKYTYENGILAKKMEVVIENNLTVSTETTYKDNGAVDTITINTINPDGSYVSEMQEFDYENNVKETVFLHYEQGVTGSSKMEHIETDLNSNVILRKFVSTNGDAYGEQCHITDYYYYKDGEILGRRVVYDAIGEENGELSAEKIYNAHNVLIWEEIWVSDSESKPISVTHIAYKENGYFKGVSSRDKRFYYESLNGENEIWFLDCDYDMATNTISAMVVNSDYCTVKEAQTKINEITRLETVYNELKTQFSEAW